MAYQPLRLTVTLETVTPLFLGGAVPSEAPELRPSSFRGVMRYWLRAAVGGILGDRSLKDLHKAEDAVFGSTGRASPVEVRLAHDRLNHQSYNPLPHKERRFRFEGYEPRQPIRLTLSGRRASMVSWNAAVGALLLSVGLGGLGRRSRRGFGSLRLRHADVSQAQLPPAWEELLKSTPGSATEWERYLRTVLETAAVAARGLVESLGAPVSTPSQPSRFPLLGADSEITICHRKFPSGRAALQAFGQFEHEFLVQHPQARNAFGSADPRWASPLWIRVLPVEGGFILGLTVLWSEPPSGVAAERGALLEFVKLCAHEWNDRPVVGQEVTQ